MKENLFTKFIKNFYGITGPLDEYRRQEINQIGNHCYIFLATFLLLGNFIAILFAYNYPTQVAWVYPVVVEAAIFLTFAYILVKTAKLKLMQIDPDELEEKQTKKLKWLGLYQGLFFAIGSLLLHTLLDKLEYGTAPLSTLTNPGKIIQSLVAGLIFGSFMHLTMRFRITKNDHKQSVDKKSLLKTILKLTGLGYVLRLIIDWTDAGQITLASLTNPKSILIAIALGFGLGSILYFAKQSSKKMTIKENKHEKI